MQRRRLVDALLGSYLAMALLPAAVLSGLVTVDTASLGTITTAGFAVAMAFALMTVGVSDTVDRVASLPVAAATILPPLAYLPFLIIAEPAGQIERLAIVGLLAVVPGLLVPVAGGVIQNQRLRAEATEHVVVTAGDDEDDGFGSLAALGIMVVAGIAMIAFGAAAGLTGFDIDGGIPIIGSLTALSGSLVTLFTDDSTELAVTDAGLRVDRSMTPWADLEGFRVTDDEIEIERARWWLPTRDFDREEIDDAALIDALVEFLPRTDATEEATVAGTT
jgi:hypothetical protein